MCYESMENHREKLVGKTFKITDFYMEGKVIFLEDKEGRGYTIDCTGNEHAVLHIGYTDKESLEILSDKFNALLEVLDISEEDIDKVLGEAHQD